MSNEQSNSLPERARRQSRFEDMQLDEIGAIAEAQFADEARDPSVPGVAEEVRLLIATDLDAAREIVLWLSAHPNWKARREAAETLIDLGNACLARALYRDGPNFSLEHLGPTVEETQGIWGALICDSDSAVRLDAADILDEAVREGELPGTFAGGVAIEIAEQLYAPNWHK